MTFLQAVIVFIGVGALAFLLWEPQAEGRNINATLFEIYFKDPFLAYAYIASIPFFVVLYKAFTVLRLVGQNNVFSEVAVKSLQTIQYSALSMIGFVVGGEIFILLGGSEELPPAIFMGLLITLGSLVIAAVASTCAGIVQNAMDKKTFPHFDPSSFS